MKTFLSTPGNVLDRPFQIYLWLAFGITWGVGGLALLGGDIRPGGASQLHPLHILSAFGPSIAGVVMTASTDSWAKSSDGAVSLYRVCSSAGARSPRPSSSA